MPNMSGPVKTPIAVVCSDIHFSHTPPPCRACEPDWYVAMERPFVMMAQLCNLHKIPLLVGGDIFDRWDNRSELVNFAIGVFARFEYGVYAIPGQHDLPQHNYEDIRRSSFWTLKAAGAISNMKWGWHYFKKPSWALACVPWGHDIPKVFAEEVRGPKVALIHKYIHTTGHSYPGAPEESKVVGYRDALAGYDVAFFGDNHKGFKSQLGGCCVVNCGGLIRRKSDEYDYKPCCAILYADGEVSRRHVLTDDERFERTENEDIELEDAAGLAAFIDDLKVLQARSFDFREEVRTYLRSNPISQRAADILLAALD